MATYPRTAVFVPGRRVPLSRAAAAGSASGGRATGGYELARGVVSRRALEEAAGVVRSRWRRVPRLLLLALLLLAVGSLGVYQVLQSSRIAELGYELRTLEGERTQLAAEVRLLEARAAARARVAELEQRAMGDLNMVEPKRTLQVSVSVPVPGTIPLPERFVPPVQELTEEPAPWWHQIFDRLPGG